MLTEAEIAVSVVAYFEPNLLKADPRVCEPASVPTEGRPFVCLAVSKGLCIWMPLTSKPGRDRSHFEIPKSMRRGGSGVWVTGSCFANKEFGTYIGPPSAFVAASALLDGHDERSRPFLDISFVRMELIPRCRERGGLDFARWQPNNGVAEETATPPAAKLVQPVLSASLKEKFKPPPLPPAPEKKQAAVEPTMENWTAFIEAATGSKGPGRR